MAAADWTENREEPGEHVTVLAKAVFAAEECPDGEMEPRFETGPHEGRCWSDIAEQRPEYYFETWGEVQSGLGGEAICGMGKPVLHRTRDFDKEIGHHPEGGTEVWTGNLARGGAERGHSTRNLSRRRSANGPPGGDSPHSTSEAR